MDATWVKNAELGSGRQYVMCTKDGVLLYADQAVAFKARRTVKSVLLDPKTPERLGLYMQRGLPLEKSPAMEMSISGEPETAEQAAVVATESLTSAPEVSAAMGDLLIDIENSTIVQNQGNGGGENARGGKGPGEADPSSRFLEMASELGLSDLEQQQALDPFAAILVRRKKQKTAEQLL